MEMYTMEKTKSSIIDERAMLENRLPKLLKRFVACEVMR